MGKALDLAKKISKEKKKTKAAEEAAHKQYNIQKKTEKAKFTKVIKNAVHDFKKIVSVKYTEYMDQWNISKGNDQNIVVINLRFETWQNPNFEQTVYDHGYCAKMVIKSKVYGGKDLVIECIDHDKFLKSFAEIMSDYV